MRRITVATLVRRAVCAGLAFTAAAFAMPAAEARTRGEISHIGFLTVFGSDHARFDAARWWITHDRANGNPRHNIGWRRDAVGILADRATLSILAGPYKGRDYAAGALKTHGRFGYGRFDVIMRPEFEPGSISAFFVYTGPAFGTQHDEIDIEFTGRSATEMNPNTYVDGENMKLPPIDLGFRYDAAPHAYAFEWTPDAVRWFVDGEMVFETRGETVPTTPGKITSSIWAAKNLDRWAGRFAPIALPITTDLYCMSWRPAGDLGPTCTDHFQSAPEFATAALGPRRRPGE